MSPEKSRLLKEILVAKAVSRIDFENYFREEILEALTDSHFSEQRIREAKQSALAAWWEWTFAGPMGHERN